MDYLRYTAPCGLDCFNCAFLLAGQGDEAARATLETYSRVLGAPVEAMFCQGCRDQQGVLPLHNNPQVSSRKPGEPCRPFSCTREKGLDFCHECAEFPCDALHPYSDRAGKVPHNLKVFNLCQIRKMGLESWARSKAQQTREVYFNGWWTLV